MPIRAACYDHVPPPHTPTQHKGVAMSAASMPKAEGQSLWLCIAPDNRRSYDRLLSLPNPQIECTAMLVLTACEEEPAGHSRDTTQSSVTARLIQ